MNDRQFIFWLYIEVFIIIGMVCLMLMAVAAIITQTNAIITFHVTSDNNTLEIFRTINYTAIGAVQ